MQVSVKKPGTPFELVHHGVKGMKWGVRKEESSSSTSGVKGLEKFPPKQAAAMGSVANKIKKAYGFNIDEVVPLSENKVNKKYLAYVEGKSKGSNVIHMDNDPRLTKLLLEKEKEGWFVPSGGHVIENIITHESAHSMFHTVDSKAPRGTKTSIEDIRKSAWKKAEEQAVKDGDATRHTGVRRFVSLSPQSQMINKISKYASSSLFVEESEAEMFSSYHWNPNPPKYVDAFMNEIHTNMGKKVQPFSGRKASNA